jgi:glycosyltransferase involved in cell wall biosynthesis
MVKVSIVVPVYNLENYLPRCLDALVNQTLEDIEILCVDDGSKDSAPQIIEDYKAKYPNKVKTFHKENGGEWSARTFGLKHATGEYIGFIDSDDVPEVTWAEKLYNAAKENDADIAFSGYDRVDMDTGKTVSTEMNKLGKTNRDVDWNDDFILYANPSLWNKLYRRELVKDSEFLPFRGANDTLFLIRSYMDGAKKLTFIPDVLYHYYLRSSSQIHNMNENDIANLKKYFLVLKEYCIKIGKYEEYKETFASMVFVHMGISWAFMLSYDKTVKMSKAMKEITEYLNENFPEWKNSKHFKLTHCLPKGFKYFAIWGVHLFYRIHLPVVYIWVNRFIRDVLKIEVKW